jgi:hypothetical protein
LNHLVPRDPFAYRGARRRHGPGRRAGTPLPHLAPENS